MSYTKEQRANRAYTSLVNYVKENGDQQKDGTIIWNRYPICVQDRCYDKIIVENDKVYTAQDWYTKEEWRDISLINYRYVDKVLADLKKIDDKRKKK